MQPSTRKRDLAVVALPLVPADVYRSSKEKMARTPTLIVIAFLLGCPQRELVVESGHNHSSIVRVYNGFENAPKEVSNLAARIETMGGNWSCDEFESALAKSGVVDTPYQHFKDFERYWRIHTDSKYEISFVLAAAFAGPIDEEKLCYATVNLVEESGGAWRTVWSIKYNPPNSTFDLLPITRGHNAK